MLTTFVIGLREGLEASLIIGIVAAFLIANAGRRWLRPMWAGVGLAVALCALAAVGLSLAEQKLPLQMREGLEGSLTLLAVVGVTYMLVWMRRNSAGLKTDLEERTAAALDSSSMWALVVLAFVAVVREGLETAIFLLAIVNGTETPGVALGGAIAGIAVASVVGYLIFKGGTRINLSRFFRLTGIVLVVVAAGLLASAIHEFAEAGLFPWGQSPALDLSALIDPGTVRAGVLTAFVGLQPVPTYAEILVWLVFLVPAGWYVIRPRPRIEPAIT